MCVYIYIYIYIIKSGWDHAPCLRAAADVVPFLI